MNTAYTPPGADAEIRNFVYLPEDELKRLAAEYGFLLPARTLMLCQGLYRTIVLRNPTLAELRFFDGFLRLWRRMPGGVRLSGITGTDAESVLVWQDICRKSAELGKTAPPSLPDISELCGKALARAGICGREAGFFVGTGAELAALCNGKTPKISLDIGSAAAMLEDHSAPATNSRADMLFLFSPTVETAADEVAGFLTAHRGMGLSPVAFTGDEGMFVHLCALQPGLDIDYSLLPGYTPETGPEILLKAGKKALLFFAPRDAAQKLQSENLPGLLLFGSRTYTRGISLRAGTRTTLSLPFPFLSALRVSVAKTLTPKAIPAGKTEVRTYAEDGWVLAGICAGEDTLGAVIDALVALAEAGGDPRTAQMSTVLELPGNDDDFNASAEALPLLFGVHRAAAELLLPSANHRQIQNDAAEHPRLSVFLLANEGRSPSPEYLENLRAAAAERDFAALRKLFF